MKNFALIAVMAAAVVLSACSKDHEKVYAVDRVEEAQAAALQKAPQAEEMIFDDHGQPTFVELSGGAATTTTPAADAAAPAGFGPHYPVAAGLDDHYVLGQQLVSTIKRQRIAVELLQKDQLFQRRNRQIAFNPERRFAGGGGIAVAVFPHPGSKLRVTDFFSKALEHPDGGIAHGRAQGLVLVPPRVAALHTVPGDDLELISHGTGLQGKQGVRNLEGGRRRKPLLRPRGVVNPHMFFAPTGIQDGDGAHSGRLRKKSRPFRAFRSHGQGRSGGAESQNRAGQKLFDFSHCRDFQESGESRATQINSRSTKK